MNNKELKFLISQGEGYNIELPQIKTNNSWFTIIFKRSRENYEERFFGKTREKILRLIKENKEITIAELSERIGISRKGVEWQINKLKKERIIKRIGGRKGGYWEVVEEEEK